MSCKIFLDPAQYLPGPSDMSTVKAKELNMKNLFFSFLEPPKFLENKILGSAPHNKQSIPQQIR